MPAFSLRSNPTERRAVRIEMNRIHPSPWQPRKCFDEGELHALADSIRQFGLISPLLVRRCQDGYELIAGERRFRAMELLGWSHADAIVTSAFDRDCALIGLIENLQREELHFLDEAEACRRILREHGLTQEELAATLSRSPSALANLLRLLRLKPAVRSSIRESGLSERHARALLQLEDEQMQLECILQAVREQMSVRRLESLIEQKICKKKKPASLPDKLLRDNRLVINALKDTVRQLRRIGVPASSRVENHGDYYEIIVTVQTPASDE